MGEEHHFSFIALFNLDVIVTGRLAGGQENRWDSGVSAFDPQDW